MDRKGCLKALAGLSLVFIFHIPRLFYLLLLASYAAVFNKGENLTANPKIHIKRAKHLLRKDNSHLLYAALELRLALERVTNFEVLLSSNASSKMIKMNDPPKKTKYLKALNENADKPHEIYIINKETGERHIWGQYRPLDAKKISRIEGKLGNLLHAQDGIAYGIANDPWYKETQDFLNESLDYLSDIVENSTPFFAYENLDTIEMIISDGNYDQ